MSDEGHPEHKLRCLAIVRGGGPTLLIRIVLRIQQERQWLRGLENKDLRGEASLFPRRVPLTTGAQRRYHSLLTHASNHAMVVMRELCFVKPQLARSHISTFGSRELIRLLWQFALLPSDFEAAGSCIEEMLAARPSMANVTWLGSTSLAMNVVWDRRLSVLPC